MPFTPFSGLILMTSYQQVPLQGIWVDVQVKGFVADVSATLKYMNEEEKAADAIFFFPMDEDAAIYSFEATVDGKTIIADLQEKEQAQKTYEEAISQGKEAFYIGEDKYTGDIFTCSVGNLPPGQETEVTLKYVQELPVDADGALRFLLPVVLNPRYSPKDDDVSIKPRCPKVPVGEVPYTLSLNAHFQSTYGIAKIESNCNITPLEYTDSDNTRAKVSLAEGHKFDRDVELLAYYTDVDKPSVTVEAGLGATDAAQESGPAPSGSIMAESVAMLNFYPSFPAGQEQSNCGEFIFLVDRSGSMGWKMNSEPKSPKRIQSAKETLVLLLKSLPLGCYFNIYGFGSHFESFFPSMGFSEEITVMPRTRDRIEFAGPEYARQFDRVWAPADFFIVKFGGLRKESVEYTQQSMEVAVKKVNKMNAKFGGTKILEPLQNIYRTDGRAGHPRQIFVLTDGEVRNTKQVIKEVQKNAENHRCFTFGIGEGASTSLIKGMARAGNGIYDFIIGKDRIQPKVLRALRYSLQPPVKEVSLTWTLPSGMEAIVLSEVPTAIFQGQSSIVYAQLNGKVENEAEGEVCLQYKFNDEILKNTLHFLLTVQNAERPTIHRLAAKTLISDLEHGSESEEVKKKILETSLQSGVVSSLTAYVAVNEDTKTPVEGTPVTRDPPLLALKEFNLIDYPSVANPIGKQAKSGPAPRKLSGWFRKMASSAANLFRTTKETPEEKTEAPPPPAEPAENPTLARLISLQNADGSWDLTPEISAVLGISKTDIKTVNPDQNMEVSVSVWVTVLAVIWLHTICLDQREEWELLEGKAVSWISTKAGSSLGEFVRVGNELLKSSVDPKVFGL